jgi:nucleotide-binding universal stress UspA family protein
MKVLFAVDGSEGSFEAVAQVARLLAPGKHQLALFCSPPSVRAGWTTNPEVLARAREGLVQAVFDEARLRMPEALRGDVQTITTADDPRHAVTAAAEAWGAELVVVGARGLTTLERLLVGSVSRSVVHASKIPVWVARSPAPGKPHQGLNVLLACETPELGRRPAELLQALAWPEGSSCRALNVVASMFAGKVPDWLQQQARSPDVEAMVQAWAREHDEELRAARARMDEFCARIGAGLRCESIVAEGEPAAVILAAIARENIDVVVLGHHRYNWLATRLLGRTSEAVLNHARSSVLIVPYHEA